MIRSPQQKERLVRRICTGTADASEEIHWLETNHRPYLIRGKSRWTSEKDEHGRIDARSARTLRREVVQKQVIVCGKFWSGLDADWDDTSLRELSFQILREAGFV